MLSDVSRPWTGKWKHFLNVLDEGNVSLLSRIVKGFRQCLSKSITLLYFPGYGLTDYKYFSLLQFDGAIEAIMGVV